MIDRYSQTWVTVKLAIEERIALLRTRLEGELDWDETIRTRARINECVQLLNIEADELPLVDQDFELPS